MCQRLLPRASSWLRAALGWVRAQPAGLLSGSMLPCCCSVCECWSGACGGARQPCWPEHKPADWRASCCAAQHALVLVHVHQITHMHRDLRAAPPKGLPSPAEARAQTARRRSCASSCAAARSAACGRTYARWASGRPRGSPATSSRRPSWSPRCSPPCRRAAWAGAVHTFLACVCMRAGRATSCRRCSW